MKIIPGVIIIIEKCPVKWSSGLGGHRPMDLRYPVRGRVTKIDVDGETFNVLINSVEYGFDMNYILNFDLITL